MTWNKGGITLFDRYLIKKRKVGYEFTIMVTLIAFSSLIGYMFRFMGFPETNIVIVYLLAVLISAWIIDSFIMGIIASIFSTLTFNYFFTEPYFTLSVHDSSYIITFCIMTMTSLITSSLTSLAKKNELIAKEKEAETKSLYRLTNQLTDADGIHAIASVVVKALSDGFSTRVAMLCFDEDGNPENIFIQQVSTVKQVRRKIEDVKKLKHRIEELRTSYDECDEFYDWPIYGRENILGVVRIPSEDAKDMNETHKRLLHSMIESTALAMDRIRVSEQRIKDREETVQERYRGTLLRSISHDLRTPLAGIMGTSEMLLDMTVKNDSRYLLAESIYNDAKWLHSLVENILSLTRLQEGKLIIKKQLEVVEEVIGSAVDRFLVRTGEREIMVQIPDEPLMIPMDARLIEQVLLNLLDNAYKHTNIEDEISIIVELEQISKTAKFTVKDSGTSISSVDLPHVFEQFYTSQSKKTHVKTGIGLGLSICYAIIKAHNGSITIDNRVDAQGVEVVFTLPLEVCENE